MLKITLLPIWKRKNVITLSVLPNIFVGVLDKYLKVLVDKINFLPVIATVYFCDRHVI